MRKQAGFMKDGAKRQTPVIDNLVKYLRHDNAIRVTKKDILGWRDNLTKTLAAKTISDVYLSTARTLFEWAVDNDHIAENPARNVKQPKPKKVYSRERGFTDVEALRVLKAAKNHVPKTDEFGHIREGEKLTDAKNWVPIICAFSGARVSEITQLRGVDIRKEDGSWIARITPDAGTVKAGGYRDVPLHPQIIEQGFIEFVQKNGVGPLFHAAPDIQTYTKRSMQMSGKLSQWLKTADLTPEGLAPNHAWRHRFKTQCLELGISDRVMDAIQGHAGRTAGDNYGDVTLKAKRDAIEKLPAYNLK
jgi:integrase